MKFFHIVKYKNNIEVYFLNILLLKYSNFQKGHSTYSYIDIFSNKSSKFIFEYDKSCIESKLLRNLIIENFKKKMENEK